MCLLWLKDRNEPLDSRPDRKLPTISAHRRRSPVPRHPGFRV